MDEKPDLRDGILPLTERIMIQGETARQILLLHHVMGFLTTEESKPSLVATAT
jgi:hypothetical protein